MGPEHQPDCLWGVGSEQWVLFLPAPEYMLLHWVQSRAGLGDPPDVRGSQPGQGWFRPLSLSEVASGTAAVLGAASPWAGVYTGLMV